MIKLYFKTIKDRKLNEKFKDIEILRIVCSVLFKTADGRSKKYDDAIIDTGAFISLIPHSI